MRQKKEIPAGQISRLQSDMVAATIAGNTKLYESLNRQYNKLVSDMGDAVFGDRKISSARDSSVVKKITQWDKYLSEGRISEAEDLIPAEADSPDVYRDLPATIAKYVRGTKKKITENSGLRSGKAIAKSPEYLHGQDGTLEYSLHVDGMISQIRVLISYETYGRTFGLYARSIDRT